MDSDIQGLKKEIAELKAMLAENTRMLQVVYRHARVSIYINILKWVAIIGISVGALYFIQPYLESLLNAYSAINDFGNSVGQNKDLIDQLKNIYLPR